MLCTLARPLRTAVPLTKRHACHRPRTAPLTVCSASVAVRQWPPTPALQPPDRGIRSRVEVQAMPGVSEGYWAWEGNKIRWQRCGSTGPAIVTVHGFGASSDHWRKNLGPLGRHCRVFAVDLLGYGYSDKPPGARYTFDTWARQLSDFIKQVVEEPAFLVCNSGGGIVGLQVALEAPSLVRGVLLLDVPQRRLHVSKQAPWQRPLVAAWQLALSRTPLGQLFFRSLANPKSVGSVLRQCYGDPAAVTDDLVDTFLKPGLQPGAAQVFLDTITHSEGPLAEEQLQAVKVPVSIVWGEKDPWEPVEWGESLSHFPCVEEFVSLPGVGHAPQDEAPQLVNPLILRFVERHSNDKTGGNGKNGSSNSNSSSSSSSACGEQHQQRLALALHGSIN